MNRYLPLFVCCIFLLGLTSCATNIKNMLTRTEEDIFTHTIKDTVFRTAMRNEPGGKRNNGTVFPSDKEVVVSHQKTQYDSIVERYYPNFIRAGLFESAGLIGTSSAEEGFGSGLFGVMGFFDPEFATIDKSKPRSVAFTGGLYRFGILEWRLRWFRDAANWSLGTSAIEMIVPKVANESTLLSYFPIYLRKRWFLSDRIPYLSVAPYVGLGYFPSQYLNVGASLDAGSLGGLNFRLYAGYAAGFNLANTQLNKTSAMVSSSFPYIGIGTSVLDFLNKTSELDKEWKHHEHSAWSIGLLEASALFSTADSSFFTPESRRNQPQPASPAVSGLLLRIAPTSLVLPVFNRHFFAGTSLAVLGMYGAKEVSVSVLPVRLGYWHTLIEDDLITMPFVEYNYYPVYGWNIGNTVKLRFSADVNLQLNMGYASGTPGSSLLQGIELLDVQNAASFGVFYFGVGIGLNDKIFTEKELRYFRDSQ